MYVNQDYYIIMVMQTIHYVVVLAVLCSVVYDMAYASMVHS